MKYFKYSENFYKAKYKWFKIEFEAAFNALQVYK